MKRRHLGDRSGVRSRMRSQGLRLALLTGLVGLVGLTAAIGQDLDGLDIQIGRALFKRAWVPAPSTTTSDDGLGPLFDARSCSACHPRQSRAPLRVSASGEVEGHGVILAIGQPDGSGDPVYGRRFQVDAVPGLTPEGLLTVRWETGDRRGPRPIPVPIHLGYGPMAAGSGLSLRVAPDLRGRAQIEQVPEAAILAIAAQQAAGQDGVKGEARRVRLPDGRDVLGRFGWKAAQPSLEAQSSEAFFLDMGLSTPLHPEPWGDCTPAQTACREAPHGISPDKPVEIPDMILTRVVAYLDSLPVPDPASTGKGPTERGVALFASTGCAQCHRPTLPLRDGGTTALFTDLLLHDMGPGLEDTLSEPGARAAQWRTAPLAGLSDALARKTGLLHDGRADGIAAAIGWHDGEARTALNRFKALRPKDQAALIAYVAGL